MKEIVLQIPSVEAEQNIEIDVRINGRKKTLRYRVEIVAWDHPSPESEEKVATLRRIIREHDPRWELVTIGAPNENSIPVMFRQKPAADEPEAVLPH